MSGPPTVASLFGPNEPLGDPWITSAGLLLSSESIGHLVLMGRPSNRWRDVQHRYYEWLKRRNTEKAWLQAVIKKVWEVSWDMWDHRNQVRLGTITPAMRREADIINAQITHQFEEGQVGLGQRDHHWLSKPLAHVLAYDPEHKSQWLESVELARVRFTNRHEFEDSSIRHQCEFMESWRNPPLAPA